MEEHTYSLSEIAEHIIQKLQFLAAFRQSVKDMEEGKVTPWEDVKKDHGWE